METILPAYNCIQTVGKANGTIIYIPPMKIMTSISIPMLYSLEPHFLLSRVISSSSAPQILIIWLSFPWGNFPCFLPNRASSVSTIIFFPPIFTNYTAGSLGCHNSVANACIFVSLDSISGTLYNIQKFFVRMMM